MAPKIFLTGVTGYIGGDIFYALNKAHPEFEYSVLVRSEEKGKPVKEAYPNARLVIDSNGDLALLEKEAAQADIVIHTADSADNTPAAKAIAKGLADGHTADKPGYWLHISGTGILVWYDYQEKRYGQPPLPEQTYHDIANIERIVNLPDAAPHRDVDKIVQAANESAGVRTAIVAPPTIYGPGRGLGNRRSIQVYDLARLTLEKGFAPVVAPGLSEWNTVHVHDLGDLFVRLVEEAAAADGAKPEANPELFGPRAYYFAEDGVLIWGDVARRVAAEADRQGFLPAPLVKDCSMAEVTNAPGVANSSWGLNSRGVAERARKFLGWEPKGSSLEDEIPEIVRGEAEKLGLEPRYKNSKV